MNFDETWAKILETLQSVVTLKKIARAVWNDRFSYPCTFLSFSISYVSLTPVIRGAHADLALEFHQEKTFLSYGETMKFHKCYKLV